VIAALNDRDRLLLAFANLASYGIFARPAVRGSLVEAGGLVGAEAATGVPFARRDYVFWLRDDERSAFDQTGALVGPLPLHIGTGSIVPAIRAALSSAGFAGWCATASDSHQILVGPIPTFDAGGGASAGVRSAHAVAVGT